MDNEHFIKEIKKLRIKYGIPENGLRRDHVFKPKNKAYRKKGLFEWSKVNGLRTDSFEYSLDIDIKKSLRDFPLNSSDQLSSIATKFFFYNKVDDEDSSPTYGELMFKVIDLTEVTNAYHQGEGESDPTYVFRAIRELIEQSGQHPIAIAIPQEAGRNDTVDFIKKNWKRITDVRDYNRVRKNLLAVRSPRSATNPERNELIYKNKHLSLRKIATILSEKGFFMDPGEIGKIRSLEIKKRNRNWGPLNS